MKILYVCGSFKFIREMNELEEKLREENVEFRISNKMSSRGILGCLEKIDEADVVYVINPDGYAGKSVCIDLGYAYAKGKSIYVMYPIDDPPIMCMVKGVLPSEELINLLKHNDQTKNKKSI